MSQSPAYHHYLRALSRWPKDALRPEAQFQDAIRRRIERISAAGKFDEKRELGQCNALYSLLEDRYLGKYPLTSKTLKPASNPTYYEDLVKELEEAPKRSWFQQQVNKWKGALRFQ
ncbi:predicted protein [Sclerotinia sclerotiorum 1980 UF-70]|uniref:Ubiquinol-cytochrome-c reductase complex assembly factor 2 n=2 Tax=Sclerotinia sclerotiorum (strain ATCC 18683 / 1980 / Ss-1) TaxID=665079 RepID=A7F3I9_SCLS1|nr:predicted protein [Sclerotinia sclerotiorum 1980 UF-70]APA14348.1 hypothetical protein sscle_12g091180 [Sclerotinia sclerotiorum 1980 UF-70]EDN97310.1 predicted protein [Sclerotinia sclerotiorum 1980 UF-70]